MKKLFALLCAAALLLSLAACAPKDETPAGDTNPVDDVELRDLMNDILDGVEDLPDYEVVELTEENFEFYTFVPYAEGDQAVAADALIGSIAHSVVLVRVPEGADAAQVAADMEQNANPRKWICVGAEATHVRQHGNTILLVMSTADIANAILMNFDACNGMETPESDLAEPMEQVEIPDDVLNDPVAADDGAVVEDNMPTLSPDEDQTDHMPALDPGDEAVEMPTVKPEQPDDMTSVPVEPEQPAEKPTQPETKPEQPETKPEEPAASGTDLLATVNTVLSGIEDLPMSMPSELTADNFEFFTFLPYADGYRGVQADSAIGSIAHSVVIVEVPEGADAAQVAADMKANANPCKWICVEAESVQTAVNGSLVLLVMSTQTTADAIVANFNAL